MKSIKCILQASLIYYSDNRQHAAVVVYLDTKGHQRRLSCPDYNAARPAPYMQAMLLRAMHEGVVVQKEYH